MLETSQWVPVLTSEAGLCLTASSWQSAKINTAVYYLDSLLLKPGIAVLNKCSSLANYVNWSCELIINATPLKANKNGDIHLKSSFDGSKLTIDYQQIIDLINHLKPHRVILPTNILMHYPELFERLDKEIIPYFFHKELFQDTTTRNYGLWFDDPSLLQERLEYYSAYSLYIQGRFNLEQIKQLAAWSVSYIESNVPVEDGLNGVIYSKDMLLDLKNELHALSYEYLSASCECSTCINKLTQAYLHHLLAHTPLLAQRFLIEHNAYYVQEKLIK